MRFMAPIPDAIFLDLSSTWFSHARFSSYKHAKRLRAMRMCDWKVINIQGGREGRLLSFCLEPINMNSVLITFSVNLLAVKPAIYVEQVFVQGRLKEVDITIRISQMGIICIHS